MQKATLGGVEGAADLRYRQRGPTDREWRGTFAFRAGDEPEIERLTAIGLAPLETLIDGEPRSLTVRILSVSPTGLLFFEALDTTSYHQTA